MPRRGRPRSAAIDARILTGALRVFGKTGWVDFSIEKAAQRADVSKATLYLRWQDKTALLTASLCFAYPPWTFDAALAGEERLVALVEVMIGELSNETGWALHRALRDPDLPDALRDCCRTIVRERLAAIDRLVAAVRGECAPVVCASPALVRQLLVGAAMGEAGDILLTGRRCDPDAIRKFAENAVRLILSRR
jgi:AcrR family transcriptional regulator